MAELKEYTFEQLIAKEDDPEHATAASFQVTVTEEMMQKFAEISGDYNPLHTDEAYAKEQGQEGRVVYGMLTASFYSKLAGMYIPGKYCLLYNVDSMFRMPVHIGDELTVSGYVKRKHESTGQIEISAQIVNQLGGKVSKAKIMAGCTK